MMAGIYFGLYSGPGLDSMPTKQLLTAEWHSRDRRWARANVRMLPALLNATLACLALNLAPVSRLCLLDINRVVHLVEDNFLLTLK